MLDTNVLLSLLVFNDSRLAPILAAIERNDYQVVTSDECLAEWKRVLGYPEFALEMEAQLALVERLSRLALTVRKTPPPFVPPKCKDPDDQKFLELAAMSGAAMLVSSDKALLGLAQRTKERFRILHPNRLLEMVAGL